MAGETILIVDDDAAARAWLTDHVLRPAGYAAVEAASLPEARGQIAACLPHLVILKDRLGANNTLALVSEYERQLPILVIATRPNAEDMSAALNTGARDILLQPIAPERMTQSIARALRTSLAMRVHDALREQIQRQNQEFNALYTVGKKVSALLDTEEILTLVVSAAVNLTGAEEGWLALIDAATSELYLRAHYNLSDAAIQNLRIKMTDPLMSRVIQSGRPIMLSGREVLRSQTELPAKAILSVPLFAGDRVTGILTVDNKSNSRPFTEHEVHLLSTLADSAAIAIENARLYDESENERAKLITIVRDIEDAVIVTDVNTRILMVNSAARSAFHLGNDVIGKLLAEAIPLQSMIDLFDPGKLRSQSWRAEVVLPDGRTLQGQLSILSGIGYGAVLHDISHLKELDRIKSEFVSIVSHDLRTPLTAIWGYVELLSRVGPLTEQQREFVTRIEKSMNNMVALLADLLDIGRIEAGLDWEKEPLQLHTVITEAMQQIEQTAAARRHSVSVDAPELPPVLGNARRLTQVVVNLLNNAVKYTRPGGHLEVALREKGDFLVLQVRDNGIGIAVEDQRHIFDKFYRVQSKETENIGGTGLGLAIVKAIVEKHGGRVWAESEPGHGSVFSVLLPKYVLPNE